MDVEEFKILLEIVPTDDLTAIRICDSVEKFRKKHPRAYGIVMEALVKRKFG